MSRARVVAIALAALAALPGCSRGPAPSAADARFADLLERNWQWRLREYPTFATSIGVNDYNDRMEDASLAAIERRTGETKAFLATLDAIPVTALSTEDRTDAEILRTQLVEAIDAARFGDHLLTLNADSGFHTGFMLLHRGTPFATVKDYENYLARLEAFPLWMDQHVARGRSSEAGRIFQAQTPAVVNRPVDPSICRLTGGGCTA